jgi:hypothetical protein
MYRKSNFYLFCPLKHKIRILQPSAQNGVKLKIQFIKNLVDLSLIAYSRCAGLLCGGLYYCSSTYVWPISKLYFFFSFFPSRLEIYGHPWIFLKLRRK